MNNEPIILITSTTDNVTIPIHDLPVSRLKVVGDSGITITGSIISRDLPDSFVINLIAALRKSPGSQLAIAADIIEENMDAFREAANEALSKQ